MINENNVITPAAFFLWQGAQGEPGSKGERGDPGLPVRMCTLCRIRALCNAL